MAGVFVLIPGLISLLVSLILGMSLTLIGFARCRRKRLSDVSTKVWILVSASDLAIMVVILALTVSVSSIGPPTIDRYGEMAIAIALWSSVPGIALSFGGLSLFFINPCDKR